MVARSGQHSDVVEKPSSNVTPPAASHFLVLGSTPGWSMTPSDRASSRRMKRMLGFAFPAGSDPGGGAAGRWTGAVVAVVGPLSRDPAAPPPTGGRTGSPAPVGTPGDAASR